MLYYFKLYSTYAVENTERDIPRYATNEFRVNSGHRVVHGECPFCNASVSSESNVCHVCGQVLMFRDYDEWGS